MSRLVHRVRRQELLLVAQGEQQLVQALLGPRLVLGVQREQERALVLRQGQELLRAQALQQERALVLVLPEKPWILCQFLSLIP